CFAAERGRHVVVDERRRQRQHGALHPHLLHAGDQALRVEERAVEGVAQPPDLQRDALAPWRCEAYGVGRRFPDEADKRLGHVMDVEIDDHGALRSACLFPYGYNRQAIPWGGQTKSKSVRNSEGWWARQGSNL